MDLVVKHRKPRFRSGLGMKDGPVKLQDDSIFDLSM